MDIVIPMNRQSTWNDNELRFALRSLEQHVAHRRVWIIGYRPDWLKNVEQIKLRDKSYYPAINIHRKIRTACETKDISERFMYMADDHYILPTFDITRTYYHQEIEDVLRDHPDPLIRKVVMNTLQVLLDRDTTMRWYDLHVPIVYEKEQYLRTMGQFDWMQPSGYAIKTLYRNMAGDQQHDQEVPDGKVRAPKTYHQLKEFIRDKVVFSSGKYVGDDMIKLLSELYPNPSKYES
jgi:hypothetical protein